jgi:hypothetical protein
MTVFVDRGAAGFVFVGFVGIEVPVASRLDGGLETDAWCIGQALERAGIDAPEAGVIGHTCAALRRAGVSLNAREPARSAPPASHRVWSWLFRPDIWATPHCAPGTEAGEMCDTCGRREAAAIDEFVGVVARANDVARELACEQNARSAWSPPVDRERVADRLQRVEIGARTARGLSGPIAHRTKVREMLVAIECTLMDAREDASFLGVAP